MRAILHVDMDAFYASVEQLDDPRLRGRPVLVGGSARRGVVLAASYEARPTGARSAMPMAEAMRLCPRAIVVPPRHARYGEVSEQVFTIFHRFTPLVQGLSLDEAFLDVTGSRSLFGDGQEIATAIKKAIRDELGLTASAGVAPSKFVAKIASDLRKPDGLVVVAEGEVTAFLAPLPIERMWGIGPKTAPRLRELGYATLGDLARADARALERHLGSWGHVVKALAHGDDARHVDPDCDAKSIGAEETYDQDLEGRASIERTLLAHASRVAHRLLAEQLAARVVTVKLKYSDFTVRSRQATLEDPACDTTSIFEAAKLLLGRFSLDRGVRLTGVSASGLVDSTLPTSLFPDPREQRLRKVEHVVFEVGERFGKTGLTRASLLPGDDRTPANLPKPRETR